MSTPEIESNAHERLLVEAQLGRGPRGRWRVARRCHLGLPMAIETYPRLEDGTPFPTLFWLTCPILIRRASRLEAAGFMNELTERLGTKGPFRERLENAIERYTARRDDHEVITATQPGGGPERVKCLHAHLAHELGDGPNPVGGVTFAAAGWPDCRTACVELR